MRSTCGRNTRLTPRLASSNTAPCAICAGKQKPAVRLQFAARIHAGQYRLQAQTGKKRGVKRIQRMCRQRLRNADALIAGWGGQCDWGGDRWSPLPQSCARAVARDHPLHGFGE